MPIYEFYCAQCDAEFEMILPVSRMNDTVLADMRSTRSTATLYLLLQVQFFYCTPSQAHQDQAPAHA